MAVLDEIISMAEELPPWQSDAARRLLTQAGLTDADKEELLGILKASHGLADDKDAPKARPLTRGAVSGAPAVAARVTLKAMKNLCNVNAIPDGRGLPFGHEGLTVIYGENASGKSGYARVLKRACRARDTAERIHPNIFEHGSGSARATFKVSVDEGADDDIEWEDGKRTSDVLANIAVYDSKCARIIVNEKNQVAHLPYGAHVFEGLVTFVKGIRESLAREMPKPEAPQYEDIPGTTEIGQFIAGLNAKTPVQAIDERAQWTDVDERKLSQLDKQIAKAEAEDPAKQAQRLRSEKGRIEELKTKIGDIDSALSGEKAHALEETIDELNAAEQAVRIVSQESLAGEPLPGVGGAVWQKLYEAAKQYSIEVAYPEKDFPQTGEGTRCVLCMQLLSEDAKGRFERFKEFMEKSTKKAADAARDKLELGLEALRKIDLKLSKIYKDAIDEIRRRESEVAERLERYLEGMQRRQAEMVKAGEGKTKPQDVPVMSSPTEEIAIISEGLGAEAQALEKAAEPESLAALKSCREELKSRKLFTERKQKILNYVQQVALADKYEACIQETNHTGITRKGTEIISAALTPALVEELNNEREALGAHQLNLNLRASGSYGETSHKIELAGAWLAAGTKLTEILSEGEQTMLGIAGFLAELKLSGQHNPIVFDDPVCSLDHRYRERVAERLAKESLDRQVIVFTHDIAFLMELEAKVSTLDNAKFFAQTIRYERVPGTCVDGRPWHAMPVKKRLSHLDDKLNEMRVVHGTQKDEYNRKAGELYGLLRETWEAAVEEILFHNTVKRYREGVQTQDLRYVSVTDEDYKKVYWGMSKCSKWMLGHDKARALDVNRPPPGQIQTDIEELRNFQKDLKSSQEHVQTRRKAVLKPAEPERG
ncbi:MAG: AAA family ATPase [Planctomycetota bacterium]|jgi:energy-coupling factor transporter ATP-binding protein EcfA2